MSIDNVEEIVTLDLKVNNFVVAMESVQCLIGGKEKKKSALTMKLQVII